MKRVAVSLSDDVYKAVIEMGKDLGVSISSLGDSIFTNYGKIEFEKTAKSLRFIENAEVRKEDLKEAEEMKDMLKKAMKPYQKLAQLYDIEDERRMGIADKALEEEFPVLKQSKKGGK